MCSFKVLVFSVVLVVGVNSQLQDFIEFGRSDSGAKRQFQECPGDQLFYDGDGTCYGFGVSQNGPCGSSAMLVNYPLDVKKGICYCPKDSSGRAVVFHRKLKQCFPIYSKGPCGTSQWLAVNSYVGECVANPCQSKKTSVRDGDIVPFQGQCVSLKDDESKACGDGKEFKFSYDGVTLECTHKQSSSSIYDISLASPGGIGDLPCEQGYIRGYDNSCQPIANFS